MLDDDFERRLWRVFWVWAVVYAIVMAAFIGGLVVLVLHFA